MFTRVLLSLLYAVAHGLQETILPVTVETSQGHLDLLMYSVYLCMCVCARVRILQCEHTCRRSHR